MASPDEQSEATTTLLERFAAVFNLTFTRFNDLKLAEAQAHQAHLDLIQLQAEKKRAEDALSELSATQAQLVQQEKLASLGQLTAGIAHEIKNPLNFVNNFSSVSVELLDEVLEEINNAGANPGTSEIPHLLSDVKANLAKIIEHGMRADGIVKSMLQHSRGGSGRMEPVDLNALIKEYVNLAFHGMRASKQPINVDIKLDLDASVGEVLLKAEDFSRVILNLCQNAFDAMREKINSGTERSYRPKLSVRLRQEANKMIISIEDNGPGIPDTMKGKVLQPFFTTKKGTQGTGLGLSITNDIVKAHGGEMNIETNADGGATFLIWLPTGTQR
jgi:signal transduction histidine kinase